MFSRPLNPCVLFSFQRTKGYLVGLTVFLRIGFDYFSCSQDML